MKKILSSFLIFFSICTNAQIDTSQIKFIEPPDSTAIGTPDGKLVSKEIGPAGGTIISEDGRVVLIFPAEALAVNTIISIQPITNLAPNGAGKAYQFEPSGIQFKKQVQIIFHYTDKEAKTCPPDLMGLVMQDDRGKWSFFDYDGWDSTAKILKGSIAHFSRGANSYKFKLIPGKRTIMVNEEISISIAATSNKFKGKQLDLPTVSPKWYVNGAQGGDNSKGTIGNIKDGSCSYKAPSMMPVPNPVTITAEIFTSSGEHRNPPTCEIEIYDAYEIKIDGRWTHFTPDNDDLKLEITETSSCTLKIKTTSSDTNWKTENIKNGQPSVKVVKCPKGCNCNPTKKDFTGMIEITGIIDVKIFDKKVTVLFEKVKAGFPLIQAHCEEASFPLMPQLGAIPSRIEFEFKDGDQIRKFNYGEDVFPIEYTFTVKRLKN